MDNQNKPVENNKKQVPLSQIEIKDENIALNVMVAMLNMAQRRGAFSMEESAKTWECIKRFQHPSTTPQESQENEVVSEISA